MKTSRHRNLAGLVLGLILATPTVAEESHEMPPYEGSSALQRVKALAGDWTGVVSQPDGSQKQVLVSYRTTANGSAVVETIFKGTPMEMTSGRLGGQALLLVTTWHELGV